MELRGEQPATDGDQRRPLWLDQAEHEVEGLFCRESVGLVAGERTESLAVLHELGRVVGTAPVSVAEAVLPHAPFRRWEDLAERLAGCPLLFDYPHLELHTEAANRRVWVPT